MLKKREYYIKRLVVKLLIAISLFLLLPYISHAQQVVDSTFVRDTLAKAVPSLAQIDSTLLQQGEELNVEEDTLAIAPKVYTKKELKIMARDSIRQYKDSIIRITPRILTTYIVPDSLLFKRMILWNTSTYFNTQTFIKPDTTFNDHFSELPYQKNDVGATYLGIAGAAMQYHNYFLRPELSIFPFYEPYLPYTHTPETIPFYNTKTPYTELAYWGTLLANKQKEETNLKILHTQNLTPAFNFNLLYQRYGASGILQKEKTDNRTFAITGNYINKRYVAEGGYIFNRVRRQENGGVRDPKMILDTIVDAKTIPITLNSADNTLKKNTLFLTHSLGFNFKKSKIVIDSLNNLDTLALAPGEGTMAFIGHSLEYSIYGKKYTDDISTSDSLARALYNNNFYINPTTSSDSMRVRRFENRFFIRLQPWAKEAIVSKLDAGIGYQYLQYYGFKPSYFLKGNSTVSQNNMYLYFGAGGDFKRYFSWSGMGVYHFAGYYQNDFSVDAQMRVSSYPGNLKGGMHLSGKLNISLNRPNYFYNNCYTNHYVWENDFDKTAKTEIEAKFEIPDYKFEAFFGYSLLKNNIYLDSLSTVRQNNDAMSVLSAYVRKDFRLWKLHLENKVLFQVASKDEVIPLPKLSLNLRYYLQFELVKNVLTTQLGANATFYTQYYAPGYSPALGLFYNQRREEIGNNPYIDVFVNMQWKRASIFVKYVNAAQNWPTGDYFSAYHYIKPQTALKFGIHWPFYVK